MIDEAVSKNGVVIRLTDERWAHITEEHCELAGLLRKVTRINRGLFSIMTGMATSSGLKS